MSEKKLKITRCQMQILAFLKAKGSINMKDISNYSSRSPANVTGHIHRLEDAGMVSRVENPKSRREKIISLTKAGINYMNKQ